VKRNIFIETDLLDVYLKILDFNLVQITYDVNKTWVDLLDPTKSEYKESTFGVHFINTALKLVIDYDLVLDPPIVEDEGGMQFSFDKLTFEGYFVPYFLNEGTPEQQF